HARKAAQSVMALLPMGQERDAFYRRVARQSTHVEVFASKPHRLWSQVMSYPKTLRSTAKKAA
ncbi:hypothetical protein, partial [Pseudomonas viridiflava]|uniref:hypothetical protein n=1 Tax=Pseudomonas viridiflava TaxID=33069 RepID=UPI0019D17239